MNFFCLNFSADGRGNEFFSMPYFQQQRVKSLLVIRILNNTWQKNVLLSFRYSFSLPQRVISDQRGPRCCSSPIFFHHLLTLLWKWL